MLFLVAGLLSPRTPYASTVKVLHLTPLTIEEPQTQFLDLTFLLQGNYPFPRRRAVDLPFLAQLVQVLEALRDFVSSLGFDGPESLQYVVGLHVRWAESTRPDRGAAHAPTV